MGHASVGLMDLRPVTFRYTDTSGAGSTRLQYGLVAEEVAEVYPDLVVSLQDGLALGVQYDKVNAMLLNEVQRQERTIQAQADELRVMRERVAAQAARLRRLEAAVGVPDLSRGERR